ncbi:MAG: hypothetical protein HGA33_00420 [Candidatus Moranbacteria bacterium]|nr:hypothetical protein [Candidatus Moranbacteria bacterium]
MKEYQFEVFRGKKGKYTPFISVSKPGVLSFSSGAQNKYDISRYKSAALLFDRSNRAIAIRLQEEEETDDRFSVKQRADNKGAFIACKSFIMANDLTRFYGKRFTPQIIEDEQHGRLLVIDLSQEHARQEKEKQAALSGAISG